MPGRQGAGLDDGQRPEHGRRDRADEAEVEGEQGESGEGAEQDACLVEDVETGERLHPALPGAVRDVGADRRVEQRSGEPGDSRGDDERGQRVGDGQQHERSRPEAAAGQDHRLVADPVGQGAAEPEHALLGQVAYAQHQADRPGCQAEAVGEVVGQVGHEHVEAEVDAELVDHQQLQTGVEGAQLGAQPPHRAPASTARTAAGAGSATEVQRVQDVTVRSPGPVISSGSSGSPAGVLSRWWSWHQPSL